MILYFRKGARVTELLLAKDTLRPGMLTKGYLFMVIESDARGHIGIMPSEREHFDLEWIARTAFSSVCARAKTEEKAVSLWEDIRAKALRWVWSPVSAEHRRAEVLQHKLPEAVLAGDPPA